MQHLQIMADDGVFTGFACDDLMIVGYEITLASMQQNDWI